MCSSKWLSIWVGCVLILGGNGIVLGGESTLVFNESFEIASIPAGGSAEVTQRYLDAGWRIAAFGEQNGWGISAVYPADLFAASNGSTCLSLSNCSLRKDCTITIEPNMLYVFSVDWLTSSAKPESADVSYQMALKDMTHQKKGEFLVCRPDRSEETVAPLVLDSDDKWSTLQLAWDSNDFKYTGEPIILRMMISGGNCFIDNWRLEKFPINSKQAETLRYRLQCRFSDGGPFAFSGEVDYLHKLALYNLDCNDPNGPATAKNAVDTLKTKFTSHRLLKRILNEIGYKYELVGRYDEAKNIYAYVAQRFTDTPQGDAAAIALLKLNISGAIGSGNYAVAQAAINELVAKFPQNPVTPNILNGAGFFGLEQSGNYAMAREVYQKVVQTFPGTPQAKDAAIAILRLDISGAIAAGDTAAVTSATNDLISRFSMHPAVPDILNGAGFFGLEHSGQYAAAKEVYQKVVQNFPDTPQAADAEIAILRMDMIGAIAAGNDSAADAAIDVLKTKFSNHPSVPAVLYGVGAKYEGAGKYEKAIALYQQVVQMQPENAQSIPLQVYILRLKAQLAVDSGDYDSAKTTVDELFETYPQQSNCAETLHAIAELYMWKGRCDEAQDVCRRLVEKYPGSPDADRATVNIRKIDVLRLIDAGEYDKADAAFAQLAADFGRYPYLTTAMFHIAEQYAKKGSQLEVEGIAARSKQCFQRAIILCESLQIDKTRDPHLKAIVWYFSGDLYNKMGDYEKANQSYQRVLDNYPNHPMAWNIMFVMGQNYDALKNKGRLLQTDADARTSTMYRQLLQKYPDSKASSAAKEWLNRHPDAEK